MTTHDTTSAGHPVAAVVPGPDLRTVRRLAQRMRSGTLLLAETASPALDTTWWRALLAAGAPAFAGDLHGALAGTVRGAAHSLLAELRRLLHAPAADDQTAPQSTGPATRRTIWLGSSDHQSDPGPAHPLTAARTLLSAPGAPSLRGRAAAA